MSPDYKLKAVVAAFFILYLVPIWWFRYFPSQDGPSHVYITEVLSSLASGETAYRDHLRLNVRPFPNWSAYGVMWAFQLFFSPLASEKLFLSLYLGLMVFSFWYLLSALGPSRRLWSLLSFFFAYNWTLFMGFYNFCLGVPLVALSLGFWWRWRDKWGLGPGVVLAALLVLVYFSHPLPLALVLASLTVMVFVYHRFRLKSALVLLLSFLPALALLYVSFLGEEGVSGVRSSPGFARLPRLIVDFLKMRFILALDAGGHAPIVLGVAAVIWLVLLFSICRRFRAGKGGFLFNPKTTDIFIVPFITSLVLYAVMPNSIGEAGFITPRLNLFSALFLIPLLSGEIGRAPRRLFSGALAALLLVNFLFLYRVFAVNNRRLEKFVAAREIVAPNSTLVPVIFKKAEMDESTGEDELIAIYEHAANYYCLGRGIVNLANYHLDWFSRYVVTWRGRHPGLIGAARYRERLDFRELSGLVDYVLLFGADKETLERLEGYYRNIFTRGDLKIFVSKNRESPGED